MKPNWTVADVASDYSSRNDLFVAASLYSCFVRHQGCCSSGHMFLTCGQTRKEVHEHIGPPSMNFAMVNAFDESQMVIAVPMISN